MTISIVEFFVEGNARPRGSKTAMPIYVGKKGHKKPLMKNGRIAMRYVDSAKGSGEWMEQVAAVASAHKQTPLWDDECTLTVHFCYHHNKTDLSTAKGKTHLPKPSAPEYKITTPDTTKLLRAVEDALKGILFTDDARVVVQWASKGYSKYNGVYVRAWQGAAVPNFDSAIEELLKGRPF